MSISNCDTPIVNLIFGAAGGFVYDIVLHTNFFLLFESFGVDFYVTKPLPSRILNYIHGKCYQNRSSGLAI